MSSSGAGAGAATQRQIQRAKAEAEASLASVRSLRDQWIVATGQNPTGLIQKEIDHLERAFKNRLLAVKWDCEDLEELVNGEGFDKKLSRPSDELAETRHFVRKCRDEINGYMNQLEDCESDRKIFSKHGIATSTVATTIMNRTTDSIAATTNSIALPNNFVAQAVAPVASLIQNPLNGTQYERLSSEHLDIEEPDDDELSHFSKHQMRATTTVFNNALYEHFEDGDSLSKNMNATKVFNNLTRPSAGDICVGTNDNEMILEMLETEYYNPPVDLLVKTKSSGTLRTFFDADRNKFLGTIAFLFSFPILLILFLVI